MPTKPFIPYTQEKTHELDDEGQLAPCKLILIVEDDLDFADVIKAYLTSAGYSVVAVTDGVQGIKKVMADDYAVILCDMVMPNLAGDMFYRAVERVRPHLCKRFIFMTGHQGDAKIDAFIRQVRGLMLWKPFELHVLMEAIQAIERKSNGSS